MTKKAKPSFWKRIEEAWIKEWPSFLIFTFIGGLIIGLMLSSATLYLSHALKPQTDIEVECVISKGANGQHSLELLFSNEADFAGKQLYVYVWGITSSSWGTDYSVYEHCDRIQEERIDFKERFKFFCEFIPPSSVFGIKIDTMFSEEIFRSKEIKIEWWGETTRYEKKDVQCSTIY